MLCLWPNQAKVQAARSRGSLQSTGPYPFSEPRFECILWNIAGFGAKVESLGKYAKRTPTQLNDIGRYLKKQIHNNIQRDILVRNGMEVCSDLYPIGICGE